MQWPKGIGWLYGAVLWVIFSVLGVISLLGFWGNTLWVGDIVSHFRMQYSLVWLTLVVVSVFSKRGLLFVGSAFFLVLNFFLVLQIPNIAKPLPGKPVYKALSFNAYRNLGFHEELRSYFKEEDPDLLLLIEAVNHWSQLVRPMKADFPYVHTRYGGESGGMAIFSKFPLRVIANEPTLISCEVDFPEGKVLVVASHPLSPRREDTYVSRNRDLMTMAQLCADSILPTIAMGDLNCTPWSSIFRKIENTSGLERVNARWLTRPTWPTDNPWLWIPIDHFLISEAFRPLRQWTGPALGSDHYPILLEFQWQSLSP